MSNGKEGQVFVYNQTRETFLATEANVADGYFSRLVGLLGKTGRWARPGRGLWIVPSHGVHTIGMLFSLDLVFLDAKKRVVHIEEYVRPFRISAVSLKANSVLELPPHTIFRTGTQVGDQLEISRLGTQKRCEAQSCDCSEPGKRVGVDDEPKVNGDAAAMSQQP